MTNPDMFTDPAEVHLNNWVLATAPKIKVFSDPRSDGICSAVSDTFLLLTLIVELM